MSRGTDNLCLVFHLSIYCLGLFLRLEDLATRVLKGKYTGGFTRPLTTTPRLH